MNEKLLKSCDFHYYVANYSNYVYYALGTSYAAHRIGFHHGWLS